MAFWTSNRKKLRSLLLTLVTVIGIGAYLISRCNKLLKYDKQAKKDPIVLAVRDSSAQINSYLIELNKVLSPDYNPKDKDLDNAQNTLNRLDELFKTKIDSNKFVYLQKNYHFNQIEYETYENLKTQIPELRKLLLNKKIELSKN